MAEAETESEQERLPQPWANAKFSGKALKETQPKGSAIQEATMLPIEKAAVILTAIGPENAASFLKDMSESSLTRAATAISRLPSITPELLDSVIAEFLLSIGSEEEIAGGAGAARRLLEQVLDDATIDKIMFDIEGGYQRKAWKALNDCSVGALAAFVAAEHPQTAAVILSELRPDKAAGVIERLDQEFAQQTVLRLSRVPVLDQKVADMVEVVIARDFLSALQRTQRTRKPADLIAGMMNNMSTENRTRMLQHLEDQKPALASEVIKVMFTFADIRRRVEPRDVSMIIKEIDEMVLTVAIKAAQNAKIASAEFVLENLPKRLAERLAEDIESMPDPTQRDGEAAQQEVVRTVQEMAQAGKIYLIEVEGLEE